jgi:hypothetical protein
VLMTAGAPPSLPAPVAGGPLPSSPWPSPARAAFFSLAAAGASFSRARLALPPCGGCIRGERRCNFASPLSLVGSLPRALPPLLEGFPGRHSSKREAKAVGLSNIARTSHQIYVSPQFLIGQSYTHNSTKGSKQILIKGWLDPWLNFSTLFRY